MTLLLRLRAPAGWLAEEAISNKLCDRTDLTFTPLLVPSPCWPRPRSVWSWVGMSAAGRICNRREGALREIKDVFKVKSGVPGQRCVLLDLLLNRLLKKPAVFLKLALRAEKPLPLDLLLSDEVWLDVVSALDTDLGTGRGAVLVSVV